MSEVICDDCGQAVGTDERVTMTVGGVVMYGKFDATGLPEYRHDEECSR